MVVDPEKRFTFTIARSGEHPGGQRPIAVEVATSTAPRSSTSAASSPVDSATATRPRSTDK